MPMLHVLFELFIVHSTAKNLRAIDESNLPLTFSFFLSILLSFSMNSAGNDLVGMPLLIALLFPRPRIFLRGRAKSWYLA